MALDFTQLRQQIHVELSPKRPYAGGLAALDIVIFPANPDIPTEQR